MKGRMSPHPWASRLAAAFLLLAIALPACAAQEALRPFATDGCSLFPDRALIGKANWCRCCLGHDLSYWRGGTAEARLLADRALRACVLRATGNEALAELMYAGVRAGRRRAVLLHSVSVGIRLAVRAGLRGAVPG